MWLWVVTQVSAPHRNGNRRAHTSLAVVKGPPAKFSLAQLMRRFILSAFPGVFDLDAWLWGTFVWSELVQDLDIFVEACTKMSMITRRFSFD